VLALGKHAFFSAHPVLFFAQPKPSFPAKPLAKQQTVSEASRLLNPKQCDPISQLTNV